MADDPEEESRYNQSNTVKSGEKEKESTNRSELDEVLRHRFVKSAAVTPSSHSSSVKHVRESEAGSPVLQAEHIPKSFFVAKPKQKSVDKLQIRSVDKSKQRMDERTEQKDSNRVQQNVSSLEPKSAEHPVKKDTNSSSQVKEDTSVHSRIDVMQQKSKEQSEQDSGEVSTERTADIQSSAVAQLDESHSLDPSPPPVDYHISEVTIGRKTTFDLDALLGDLDLEQDLLDTLPMLETIKETSSVSVDDKTEVVNDLVDVNDLWECVVVYDYQADTNETLSVHVGEHVWGVTESGDWTQIRTEKGEVSLGSSV